MGNLDFEIVNALLIKSVNTSFVILCHTFRIHFDIKIAGSPWFFLNS